MTLTPTVPCPVCGTRAWRLLDTKPSRTVGTLRARIYRCGSAECAARLYTHEHAVSYPSAPVPSTPTRGRRATVDDTPCPRCHATAWNLTGTLEAAPDQRLTVRQFLYTCACSQTMLTAERLKGITERPTPPERRGRRPHPHL
ncbi:hypothetical protein [Deinococcus kurensis]|uniref:hypothetical protein n=1 Tax=Deinococcus kurensis TaxID=2662757 RepID=UPI0012D30EC4|nr:hypothetical protein [Deinococcus kurensis]